MLSLWLCLRRLWLYLPGALYCRSLREPRDDAFGPRSLSREEREAVGDPRLLCSAQVWILIQFRDRQRTDFLLLGLYNLYGLKPRALMPVGAPHGVSQVNGL